jgi:carboxyl-terminal processing protease
VTAQAVRASITVPSVDARFIKPGIAYVHLFYFVSGAGAQLRSRLQSLAAHAPIRAIILDLRGNRGGLNQEGDSVAGVFLPTGTVIAIRTERGGTLTNRVARGESLFPQTPLAVLTDGDTGSNAEVVTIALRDARRATIIGEKTAGALGSDQFVDLPEGGMAVTIARVTGPQHEVIEDVGVTPDVHVPLTGADMERGQDSQLEAALKAMGAAVARLPVAA